MIESIKMGIKLFRYTWGIKMSLLLAAAFFLIGIVTSTMPVRGMGVMSSYLLIVAAMYPAQMLWSLNTADIVQTSPWKKRMQTAIPALANGICFFAVYLLVLGIKALQLHANPDVAADIVFELLMDALTILTVMLYYGAAFKMMYLATALFIVFFMAISFGAQFIRLFGVFDNVPLWAAVCSGFGAIIVGAVLQYGLMLLLYKRPLSKGAQSAGLRKHM